MNSKKVNRTFLATVVVMCLSGLLLGLVVSDMVPGMLISQALIILVPLIVVLGSGESLREFLRFRKIKLSTIGMTVLFTFLITPLIVLVNAISMLFVENEVSAVSGEILKQPFWIMFFIMGILGPVCEEVMCRGIFYQGYKRSGSSKKAMLFSAGLFALFHMNFNQASYAFAMGILFVCLVEATGSIWSAIICHGAFNSWQVCSMYFNKSFLARAAAKAEQISPSQMQELQIIGISAYLILATIFTTLAVAVLIWIAKNEQREENLRAVWAFGKNKNGGRMFTMSLGVGVAICLVVMIMSL